MPMSDRKRDKKFIQAAGDGNLGELGNLLGDGADINAVGGFWQMHTTALGLAAFMDKPASLRWLLDKGADINKRDAAGCTPLLHAVINSHYRCVSLLLEAGANMYIADSGGKTARQHVSRSKGRAIGMLLDQYDKNRVDAKAKSLENFAAQNDNAPAPAPAEDPDVIIFRQQVGNRLLEEVFNFAARERVTFVRKDMDAPVETMTRQSFADMAENPLLRKAFAEHVARGGTTQAADIFPADKAKVTRLPEPKS